jgi:ElaB/YqjD/DUF883 family membrane-anchored ribosome-binding protein
VDSTEQHEERELEMIREEMDRKRAALADKLGALESQVLGTVQSATEAVGDAKEVVVSVKDTIAETAEAVKDSVTGTISSVKGALSDTAHSVAETFNVARHVENHPWAAMGCAVATGFTAGLLIGGSRTETEKAASGDFSDLRSSGAPPTRYEPAPPPPQPAAAQEEGVGSQVMDSLGGAWQRLSGGLQGLAVGSLLGLVRHMAMNNLPSNLTGEVGRFLDDVMDRLGGKNSELTQTVVNYVKEAVSSDEEAPAHPDTSQSMAGQRHQSHDGPRHRAAL